MKEAEESQVCIRTCRNDSQIHRCKSALATLNDPIEELTAILALTGNAVRFKILFSLQREERLCVCDLSDILEMKISAVSQHLRKMKDADLVFTKREGTRIFYYLSSKVKPVFTSLTGFVEEAINTDLKSGAAL